MKELYVDRIENDIAVCVDKNGKLKQLSLKKIIGKVVEGSVLIKKGRGIVVDETKTIAKRNELFKLQKELFDKD